MKNKNLEALQEIAVKILKLNEKTTMEDLCQITKELHEGLIVQVYLQNNTTEIRKELQDTPASKRKELTPVEQLKKLDNSQEQYIEKINDMESQTTLKTDQVEGMQNEILTQNKSHFNELEEFAATYQETPVFEKKDSKSEDSPKNEAPKQQEEPPKTPDKESETVKKKSLNDKLTKNIQIGLNDRLSLTKHLFADNAGDYNRVVSQVTTLGSFDEAHQFIMEQVKSDYNWEGKEIYLERFLSLIQKRFD